MVCGYGDAKSFVKVDGVELFWHWTSVRIEFVTSGMAGFVG